MGATVGRYFDRDGAGGAVGGRCNEAQLERGGSQKGLLRIFIFDRTKCLFYGPRATWVLTQRDAEEFPDGMAARDTAQSLGATGLEVHFINAHHRPVKFAVATAAPAARAIRAE